MDEWRRKLSSGERWNEADGAAAVDAWRSSGETMAAFCRKHGIHRDRLIWWRDREAPSELIPVRVTGISGVCVRVGSIRIETSDVTNLDPMWLCALATSLKEIEE